MPTKTESYHNGCKFCRHMTSADVQRLEINARQESDNQWDPLISFSDQLHRFRYKCLECQENDKLELENQKNLEREKRRHSLQRSREEFMRSVSNFQHTLVPEPPSPPSTTQGRSEPLPFSSNQASAYHDSPNRTPQLMSDVNSNASGSRMINSASNILFILLLILSNIKSP